MGMSTTAGTVALFGYLYEGVSEVVYPPAGSVKRSLVMVLCPFEGAIAKAFGLDAATRQATTTRLPRLLKHLLRAAAIPNEEQRTRRTAPSSLMISVWQSHENTGLMTQDPPPDKAEGDPQ
jgi:hypothetical protein